MIKEQLLLSHPLGYSLTEVAKIAGVHPNTVRYQVQHRYLLPFVNQVGQVRFTPAEVSRWISTRAASNINS